MVKPGRLPPLSALRALGSSIERTLRERSAWLSITPEPERELPSLVATLAAGRAAPPADVAAQTDRLQRLVVCGDRRRWLDYLHESVGLIERRGASADPDVIAARGRAAAVIANHHQLLLGLPGPGARATAAERAFLEHLDHQGAA